MVSNKLLLLGDEAIAQAAIDAGISGAYAYPGTPSSEILEFIINSKEAKDKGIVSEWTTNEKTAMESALGVSYVGKRSIVCMKHVGLNVAADAFINSAITGANGGMVVVTADDPSMHSSQNEQDNRGYGRFAKLPVIEPSDSQEAKDFTKYAFELSEKFDTPVMLRVTTRLSHSQTMVEVGELTPYEIKAYKKNAPKFVMLPGFAKARHVEVEKRMLALKEYAETTTLNRIEWGSKKLGIITSGIPYQYVKEALPEASVLKLGLVNPLPEQLIRSFASEVERLIIIEELEPVIEEQVKSWGIKVEGKEHFSLLGEYSPELIEEKLANITPAPSYGLDKEIPPRPPLMCPGCPHRGVFHTLKKKRLTVMGDIGCYTLGALSPLDGMDACICMGASIGTALGIEKARGEEFAEKTVAVIGDSTFVHSGITPLIDIVYNQGNTTVMILDNDTTAMTGHQEHPGTGITIDNRPTARLDIEKLVRAIGINNVQVVDPLKIKELEKVLNEELKRKEPSVIIAKRPCALLKRPDNVVTEQYYVDNELCTACKSCIKVGCTGIFFNDETNKAEFNLSNCVGCGLCPQVCKFDAIKVLEG